MLKRAKSTLLNAFGKAKYIPSDSKKNLYTCNLIDGVFTCFYVKKTKWFEWEKKNNWRKRKNFGDMYYLNFCNSYS